MRTNFRYLYGRYQQVFVSALSRRCLGWGTEYAPTAAAENLSRTPGFNEAAPQFSRDGSKLLYRRLKRDELVSGNR